MNRIRLAVAALVVGLLFVAHHAHALNITTHDLVNQTATDDPRLSAYFATHVGFLRGLNQPVNGKQAIQWIGEGGIREDDWLGSLNHFHDPLLPFDSSGLRRSGLQFPSSVTWMQRDDDGQPWSWPRARRYFHAALTATDPVKRELAWADTLRALGQVMHLVVDASVPEHTRNDIHALEAICRFYGLRCLGNYEHWVSDRHKTAAQQQTFRSTYLSSPIEPDPALLRQAAYANGGLPVTRLIDVNRYTGTDPNVTLASAIGVAEYANANFFSESTIDLSYPFPFVAALQPSALTPTSAVVRRYFKKTAGDGVPVDPVAAECVLYRMATRLGVERFFSRYCADGNVWQATARDMLPHAVGYARATANYFFRGRIEIAAPDRFVYGVAPYVDGNRGAFSRLRFKIRNVTPDEMTSTGEVVAVLQYRDPGVNIVEAPHTPLPAAQSFKVSKAQTLELTDEFKQVDFDFGADPIPANATDVFLMVVYKGPLGLESDAVVVGGKRLFEPTPIDILNATDYYCYNGALVQVSSMPAWNPPTQEQRDLSDPKDHVPDVFGPYDEANVFMKAGDIFGAIVASPSRFDARVPVRRFAEYTRYLVLVGEPFYATSWFMEGLVDRGIVPAQSRPNVSFILGFFPNVNRLVLLPDGSVAHAYVPVSFYRGVASLGGAVLPPQLPQSFLPCLVDSIVVPPNFTRIESPIAEP